MFKQLKTSDLTTDLFSDIGKQWMLVTAAKPDGSVNSMTASWGGLGVLWNKKVATIYVRPQRYTHEFLDAADRFTLSFLPETYRGALTLCGKTSGRDGDKIAQAGLTLWRDGELAAFEQAERIIICRKIYKGVLDPAGFIDAAIDRNYPQKDYHTIFIGEIEQCLIAKLNR